MVSVATDFEVFITRQFKFFVTMYFKVFVANLVIECFKIFIIIVNFMAVFVN